MRIDRFVPRLVIFVSFGLAIFLGLAEVCPADTSPASNPVRRAITPVDKPVEKRSPRVEIFVTSWCPYCRALEKFLTKRQIPYNRYDVEHDAKGISEYQALGAGGVPIIRIDGEKILRGFSIEAIEEALRTGPSNPELVVSSLDVKNSRNLVER